MSKKRKSLDPVKDAMVELNVMPFIDIFSLLCTFLLFSAVFVSIGVMEVQVPFLSNAAPPKAEEKKKSTRNLEIKIEVSKKDVKLTSSFTEEPVNENTQAYGLDSSGLTEMHKQLVSLKLDHPDSDSVTLFIDDEVVYDEIVDVLDQIKLRYPSDSPNVSSQNNEGKDVFLYQKVIFGSVLL
ncbi:MAG: biopolymer transporter ExbD [Zetaproteobacteria bacterium]|nr:biopolymer transporter ExbD [Zetaproteobacteria bacterium]